MLVTLILPYALVNDGIPFLGTFSGLSPGTVPGGARLSLAQTNECHTSRGHGIPQTGRVFRSFRSEENENILVRSDFNALLAFSHLWICLKGVTCWTPKEDVSVTVNLVPLSRGWLVALGW